MEEYSETPHPITCYQNQAIIVRATRMLQYYEEESFYEVQEIETSDDENSDTGVGNQYSSSNFCDSSGFCTSPYSNMDDMGASLFSISSSVSSFTDDDEEEEEGDFSSMDFSNSSLTELEKIDKRQEVKVDPLYQIYAERMKWFDILSRDRLFGIDAIMKELERSRNVVSGDKMEKEKLIKSLRSDFELVYVAQSCLSWEALQHQYCKVYAFAAENGVFHKSIADGFQKFQILLERFMEEKIYGSKWHMNYVHKRFSIKNLLQVPEASGYKVDVNERMDGEAIEASEVLKAIEKCIKVFWQFVEADCKKTTWKFIFSNISWTFPPVEDPRDLELLYHLRNMLQKKEVLMKRLEGKKKKVNPVVRETEKYDILFTMIELKLVRKVLLMSGISTMQLQWCQTKLNNIHFNQGKVERSRATFLFPSS